MRSADRTAQAGLAVDLAQLGSLPLSLAGGKALNLGKLTAAGFPVPGGFCLTTAAYRMAAPEQLAVIAAELEMDGVAGAERDGLARQARELIAATPVPADVESAIRTAYAALGGSPAVAVRSSATAEDLPFASFAGLQDSFLNIVGADAVVDAVRLCWASLWTDRAVAYRSANGIGHGEVGLAVVVQALVPATAAGVLFTANPVTGTRTETVIDSSLGPGQAVVSGAVNPDHFVIDTATGRVVFRAPGGHQPGSPSLSDARLLELTALGGRVQHLFDEPQDVEWVIDARGKAWVTQSRPITTLYPLPDPASTEAAGLGTETETEPASGPRVYMCATLLQGLTRPITPIGLAALGVMRNRKGPWRVVNPGLRMFVDLTPVVRNKYGRRYLERVLPLADGRSAAVFPALLADPRFAVVHRPLRESLAKRADRRRQARGSEERVRGEGAASLGMLGAMIPAIIRAVLRPNAELRRTEKYGRRLAAQFVLAEPASALQRLDHAEHLLDRTVDELIQVTLPGPSAGYIMLALARRLLRGIAAPRELEAVLRGLPHNVTTEMDLELWQLAVTIGRDPAAREAFMDNAPPELAFRYGAGTLPAVAQSGVRTFLEHYGHRAVAEIDLGMPRWSEKPDHILGMISNYLRVEDPEQAPDRQFGRAVEHAEERIRSLVERAGARSRLRARLLELCLRRARQLSG
jgi:pyruvate,water dikinase